MLPISGLVIGRNRLTNRLIAPKREWKNCKINPNKEARIDADTQETDYMKEM